MKTETKKTEENLSMYSAPQCLRNDPGKNGQEYTVISEFTNKLKPGSVFYYGITGKFYTVKKNT